jgi:hypothetical protein
MYNKLGAGEAITFLLIKSVNYNYTWTIDDILQDVEETRQEHYPLNHLDEILEGMSSELTKLGCEDDTSKIDNIIDIINQSDEIQEFLKEFVQEEADKARYIRYIGLFFKVEDPQQLWIEYRNKKE